MDNILNSISFSKISYYLLVLEIGIKYKKRRFWVLLYFMEMRRVGRNKRRSIEKERENEGERWRVKCGGRG